jgi:hypothetical protein
MPKTQNTTLARYADDTAIMTRSKQPRLATAYLQEAANALETWVRRWRIEVNPEKSSALLIIRRRVEPEGQVHMFGEDITWSRVVIDNKRLTFIPHVNYGVGRGDMVNCHP